MIRTSLPRPFATVLVAILLSPSAAQAGITAEACASAAERGQRELKSGHLKAARAELVTCNDAACPAFVRRDCISWLETVEKRQPMLVVAVHDEQGKDITKARVTIDGASIPIGIGTPLDPGTHEARVDAEGFVTSSESIAIVEAVRDRVVTLTLHKLEAPKAPPAPSAAPRKSEPPHSAGAVPWVVLGVGVVGLGLFGAFEAMGWSQRSDIEKGCASRPEKCTDDELEPGRNSFRAAGISLAVGVVGIASSAVLFTLGGSKNTNVAVEASPNRATVRVRF